MAKAAFLRSSHDQVIRAKLLNRLGIHKTNATIKTTKSVGGGFYHQESNATGDQRSASSITPLAHNNNNNNNYQSSTSPPPTTVLEPLKDFSSSRSRRRQQSTYSYFFGSSTSFLQAADEEKKEEDEETENDPSLKRRIRFHEDVTVMHIPSHREFSNRIKKFLWSNGEEIQQNAERNRIEFAAEGWDWNTVLEDDDMYVDATTGELVHPCWFEDFDEEEVAESNVTSVEEEKEDEASHFGGITGPSLSRSQSFNEGLHTLRE